MKLKLCYFAYMFWWSPQKQNSRESAQFCIRPFHCYKYFCISLSEKLNRNYAVLACTYYWENVECLWSLYWLTIRSLIKHCEEICLHILSQIRAPLSNIPFICLAFYCRDMEKTMRIVFKFKWLMRTIPSLRDWWLLSWWYGNISFLSSVINPFSH